jgi:hypothetical protein
LAAIFIAFKASIFFLVCVVSLPQRYFPMDAELDLEALSNDICETAWGTMSLDADNGIRPCPRLVLGFRLREFF